MLARTCNLRTCKYAIVCVCVNNAHALANITRNGCEREYEFEFQ